MCFSCRENKYIPPGQRNRDPMSWGPGRQNSPRLAQSSGGPSAPRPGPHDYSPNSGPDQRVVNGGVFLMSRKSSLTYVCMPYTMSVIFDIFYVSLVYSCPFLTFLSLVVIISDLLNSRNYFVLDSLSSLVFINLLHLFNVSGCFIFPVLTGCRLRDIFLDHLSFPLLGSSHWPSPCPSPSSRPSSRYQSGPSSLPPRATTPTRPSRPPSRPSRPPSHSSLSSFTSSSSSFSHHGSMSPASTLPKRMSSEGTHISLD